jgi:hypothetical protein
MKSEALHGKRAYKCHACCSISKCVPIPTSFPKRLLNWLRGACFLHSRLRNNAECLSSGGVRKKEDMRVHRRAGCVVLARVDTQILLCSIEEKGTNAQAGVDLQGPKRGTHQFR